MVPSRSNSITACAFDHRAHLPLVLRVAELLLGDVGGELDDGGDVTVVVEHRVVGRLNPDLAPALAVALVLGRLVLAAVQGLPELPVLGALAVHVVDEHAVVLPDDLVEGVADDGEEVVVGVADGPVEVELNHGLRAASRLGLRDEARYFGQQLLVRLIGPVSGDDDAVFEGIALGTGGGGRFW